MFNMMKSKINYLQEFKYGIESRLDNEAKPMTEDQMKAYHNAFTQMS